MSTRNRSAPSAAKRSAIARPMPEAAPVTSTFLPRISRMTSVAGLCKAGDSIKPAMSQSPAAANVDQVLGHRLRLACLRSRLAAQRRQRLARRNHAREDALLEVFRRNRPAQPQPIFAAEQRHAPLSRLYLPPLYTLR